MPTEGSKITNGCLTPDFLAAQKRAEMLRHPCMLGGPQHQAQGAKAQVVVALLSSWQPKRGQKCYVTPAWSGVHNAKRGEQNQKWLPHPCLLGGPKKGGNALPPLPSQGAPMPSKGSKITNGCLTPDFLAAQKRAEMLHHPCMLGGPQRKARGAKAQVVVAPQTSWQPNRGHNCYVPLRPRRSPTPSAGSKIRSGYLNPAFSGGKKRAEMLCHPCLLGGPQCQARGAKSEMVVSLLTSWQPTRGQKCYITPACSGVPNAKRGEQNQKWLYHPCLLGGPKKGGNALPPLPSQGAPMPSKGSKITNGCLTRHFLAAQKRAEMLHHPCVLGGPQRKARGANVQIVVAPQTSWQPKRGQNCYVTPASSEVPNAKRGEQNQKWLSQPSPSRGVKRGQKCFATPTFSGVLNAKRGEQNQKWLSHS